ncbi:hypothetical protein BH10PSE17_BH10PSE17_24960 [soil metagenome]
MGEDLWSNYITGQELIRKLAAFLLVFIPMTAGATGYPLSQYKQSREYKRIGTPTAAERAIGAMNSIWLSGFLDGFVISEYTYGVDAELKSMTGVGVCFPPNVRFTNPMFQALVDSYVDSKPTLPGNVEMGVVAVEALKNAYPCTKTP